MRNVALVGVALLAVGCPKAVSPLSGLDDDLASVDHLRAFEKAFFIEDRATALKEIEAAVKAAPNAPYPRLVQALWRAHEQDSLPGELGTVTRTLGERGGVTKDLLLATRAVLLSVATDKRLAAIQDFTAKYPDRKLERLLLLAATPANDPTWLQMIGDLEKQDPGIAAAWALQWRVLTTAGRGDDALAVLDAGLAANPDNAALQTIKAGGIKPLRPMVSPH